MDDPLVVVQFFPLCIFILSLIIFIYQQKQTLSNDNIVHVFLYLYTFFRVF